MCRIYNMFNLLDKLRHFIDKFNVLKAKVRDLTCSSACCSNVEMDIRIVHRSETDTSVTESRVKVKDTKNIPFKRDEFISQISGIREIVNIIKNKRTERHRRYAESTGESAPPRRSDGSDTTGTRSTEEYGGAIRVQAIETGHGDGGMQHGGPTLHGAKLEVAVQD